MSKRGSTRRKPTASGPDKLAVNWPRRFLTAVPRRLGRLVKRGTGKTKRSITGAPARIAAAVRRSVTEQRTIRPEPIGAKKRNLRKIYSIALVGVAALIVLAWLNNRQGFATAFLIALLMGLIFIAWTGYRSALATAGAIGWWLVTTPLIALTASIGLPPQDAMIRAATSNEAIIGTGIAVWVAAVLMRARRTWLTIMVCWAINALAVLATGFVAPRFTLAGGWLAIALYILWRAGWLLRMYDKARGRARLGRLFETATEEQYEVYGHLTDLPSSYIRLYQLAVPTDYKPATTIDALVIGPTGLFQVTAVDGLGRIAVNVSERRRVTVEGASIDAELTDIAQTARALARAIRVEVVPIVAMCGSTFPEGSHGLLSIAVTLPGKADVVPLTLIDAELIARRIKFGAPVYTTGQVQRILHRVNEELWPAAGAPDRRARRRRRVMGGREKFTPGANVEWVDESGTWSGWVCVSRVTVLDEVPKGTLASTLSVKDKVVWIVAKAEWERARSEGREPDPELIQPVAVASLRLAETDKDQTSPAGDGAS